MIIALIIVIVIGAILGIVLRHLLPLAKLPSEINTAVYWISWIVFIIWALRYLLLASGNHSPI